MGVRDRVVAACEQHPSTTTPGVSCSVDKLYADFKSRGIGVSKETLLRYLEHFEDAFLLLAFPLAAESERRRQVNPRKLYLADHGLAHAFNASGGLTPFCP